MAFSNNMKSIQPKKWMRFKKWSTDDYTDNPPNIWSAICFVPTKNITFCGFGMWNHFRYKYMKVKVMWQLGDHGANFSSEEFEIEKIEEDYEPDVYWSSIDIRDLGQQPIPVAAGEEIHVKIKSVLTDYQDRKVFYGYLENNDSDEEDYEEFPWRSFEGQEYDFDVKGSNLDDYEETSRSWGQFPFILYF